MQTIPGPVVLFASAWNIFKAHWKILVSISLVPYVLLYLGQTFLSVKNVPYGILGVVLTVLGSVLSVAMQPTIITAINRISGESTAIISVKEQYKVGFKYFWPLLGLSLLSGVIFAGSVVWFVVPALIVGIYTSLYIYSRVLDDKKGLSALTDSYSMIKGRFWSVLWRMFFLVVVYAVASMIIFGLLFIVVSILSIGLHSIGGDTISGFLNMLLSAVFVPFTIVYLYNLYISLRSSRLPDVNVDGFRKWLKFFIVVGAIIIVVTPIIALGVFIALPALNTR